MSDQLDRYAKEFGVDEISPWQREAMESACEGRDTVVLAPTGAGKSLVYLVTGRCSQGWTLVISPLIALQQDQLEHLHRFGGIRAEQLDSSLGKKARRAVLASVAAGDLDYLYLAPEQLSNDDVTEAFERCPPAVVAVDEAHSVSEWGHDFRPDYLRIGRLLDRLDGGDSDASRAVRLALTATAAPPVLASIEQNLTLQDAEVITAALARPNLALAVHQAEDIDAVDDLVERLLEDEGRGLVYARTRKHAEQLAERIGAASGRSTEVYHAGLSRKRRDQVQGQFFDGEVDIVVATSAFGMGIDRPDVRFLVHAGAPASIDTYCQELGRAGRDGDPARVTLVHRPEDRSLGRFFAGSIPKKATVKKVLAAADEERDPKVVAEAAGLGRDATTRVLNLLETAEREHESPGVSDVIEVAEERRRLEDSRVEMVREYAETPRCRWQWLSGYFGQSSDRCGTCDNCRSGRAAEAPEVDAEESGERVEHPEFGVGTIVEADDERITVLFEEVGYKTLGRELVEEHHLLERR